MRTLVISGAPAARRVARAEPHTHLKWEFKHVHGEPDGNPCISFFIVRVTSAMVRGRVATAVVSHLVPRPSLGNQAKVFFSRAFCGSPRLHRRLAHRHFSHQLQHYRKHVECAFEKIFYLTSSSVWEASIANLGSSKLSIYFLLFRLVCGLYCAHYFFKIFRFSLEIISSELRF